MNSINTNIGAMVALQNLNAINKDLQTTQNRISTGLKVASAKDDGATWAIAQQQRATVSSLDAVKQSLSRNSSVVDVALTAGESVSDLLSQLRDKALEASDTSLDSTARSALNNDFVALRNQITKTLANAGFNGINLLDGSKTSIAALANAEGTSRLTVPAQNMSLGGSIVTLTANAGFTTGTAAGNLLSILDASINNVSSALGRLGTSSKSLDTHLTFIGKLQDTITVGIGNLVDADLAKESARLQSLQVRQQLAIQMLSISAQSQSWVLSLFRQ
jgi:flagellin